MRFRSKPLQKSSYEPRFADDRIAGIMNHLTRAARRPREAPQQQLGLFLAPDESSQTARMQCLEAAFDAACPQRHPGAHRPAEALKLPGAEVLQLKEIAEKAPRIFCNDYGVRLGNPLQTRCKIWRLADNAVLLPIARSNQIADDGEPSGDANSGLQ